MKTLKYIIPNGITLLNLLAGSFAIVFTFEGYQWLPVYLILFAAFADLLDGFAAKMLKATSEFGKQLDSLADLISFGLAPSIIMYKLMMMVFVVNGDGNFLLENSTVAQRIILFSSFNLVAFGAMRLARFNTQKITTTDFVGLPIPASALFVVSIWAVVHSDISGDFLGLILNFYFMLGVIFVLSILMVTKLPMISLKFEGFGIRVNSWRYFLIAGAVLLYLLFGITSLLFIMVFYLFLSLLKAILR